MPLFFSSQGFASGLAGTLTLTLAPGGPAGAGLPSGRGQYRLVPIDGTIHTIYFSIRTGVPLVSTGFTATVFVAPPSPTYPFGGPLATEPGFVASPVTVAISGPLAGGTYSVNMSDVGSVAVLAGGAVALQIEKDDAGDGSNTLTTFSACVILTPS